MSEYLTFLLPFQRFFLPGLLSLFIWSAWRTAFRKDMAVGLALYLGLVIVVDGFLNTGIYLPGLEKGSIRYSEVCALFLLWNRPPAHSSRPGSPLVAFCVWTYFVLLGISALRSDPLVAGIFEYRRLIIPQIVAFLVARRGLTSGNPDESGNDYRRFFLSMTALVVVIGLFVFWDVFFDRWLLQSEVLNDPMYWMNRRQNRFGSFFLNPNYLGAFSVLVFPALFVRTLNEPRLWPRLYFWLGILTVVFCLIETQSRGPMLAFAISILLLVVGPCGGVSRIRRSALLILMVVALTAVMPGFLQHAMKRFDSIEEETTAEARSRQSIWLYTVRAVADYPVAGIGFGEHEFRRTMDEYGFSEEFGIASFDNPHNSYLQMAIYAGIPALLFFVLANLALLWRAFGLMWRDVSSANSEVVFGLSVGLMGFLAAIYPDMHMFTVTVAPVYWIYFGLLLSSTASRQVVASVEPALAPVRPQSWAAIHHSVRAGKNA